MRRLESIFFNLRTPLTSTINLHSCVTRRYFFLFFIMLKFQVPQFINCPASILELISSREKWTKVLNPADNFNSLLPDLLCRWFLVEARIKTFVIGSVALGIPVPEHLLAYLHSTQCKKDRFNTLFHLAHELPCYLCGRAKCSLARFAVVNW